MSKTRNIIIATLCLACAAIGLYAAVTSRQVTITAGGATTTLQAEKGKPATIHVSDSCSVILDGNTIEIRDRWGMSRLRADVCGERASVIVVNPDGSEGAQVQGPRFASPVEGLPKEE